MDWSRKHVVVSAMAVAFLSVVAVSADPVSGGVVTLVPDTMTGLLGGSYSPAGSFMITPTNSGDLHTSVYSQAFTNGVDYAYLYQVVNTGSVDDHSAELLTLWPVTGVSDMGWLTGDLPAGFLGGACQAVGSNAFLTSKAQISFYFTLLSDLSVDPGEHSVVLYAISPKAPSEISGSVINGATATGQVVGPIPEPATLSVLALGALTAVIRRKRNA
ncbi:MAG: PEP-CTERM sorting domain-containing protein [Planctomycetota bacterium]|nr:PEP-CTERM sorting domain-containing protein [Planctomycetota bacterium]